ncbi:MAG: carbohydrate ABC transporter permease [Ruminiclostridium sp.]|nr:carbohydrate ABC transporter permease [Ruminiclostridium sp.]
MKIGVGIKTGNYIKTGKSMKMRNSMGEKIFNILNLTFFMVFCITIIYPIYQIVVNSFSAEAEILSKGFRLIPEKLYFVNWQKVLLSKLMWNSFYNSVFVTALASVYSMFLSATYAYPLSRKDMPDRNFWTFFLIFTMFFSGGLIPYFLLMRDLGLVNTRWVLIIGSISVWNTLIMRNFFMTIPDSLQESAKIDGASDITVMWKIILPLSLPVLATVLLWNLVANWNAWVNCLIYISDPGKQVLQIVLRNILTASTYNILSQNGDDIYKQITDPSARKSVSTEGIKAAIFLFTTFPILVSYPFLQKYFVKGIMIGSLKG